MKKGLFVFRYERTYVHLEIELIYFRKGMSVWGSPDYIKTVKKYQSGAYNFL